MSYIEQYQRVLDSQGRADGSQWMFPCPFEGCKNYDKWKLRVSPETGAWQCKHCNQAVEGKIYREDCREPHGGSWRDFVKLVGDEANMHLWPTEKQDNPIRTVESLPRKKAQVVWACLFAWSKLEEVDRNKLLAKGINPDTAGYVSSTAKLWQDMIENHDEETLIRAGLAYKDDKNNLYPTRCIRRGRILIPYYQGQTIFHFVGYMKCPEKVDSQSEEEYREMKRDWPKIAGPTGFTTQIYGQIPQDSPYLIVTEGQIKAEAAIQKGFPCVGLPGMGNNHKEVVKECNKKNVSRVIILFDTQLEDQENVDYEAERLARELLKKNIQPFKASLPAEGEEKVDIDSYLLTHSTEDFVEVLVESAKTPYLFGC